MAESRNLCGLIPTDLHARFCEERDKSGLTNSQYLTNLLTDYYRMKENGGTKMENGKTRTMAFQISEDLFGRLKAHLERETQRTGRRLTQRDFVVGLIERAIADGEREADKSRTEAAEEPEQMAEEEPEEAAVAHGEDADGDGGIQPPQKN